IYKITIEIIILRLVAIPTIGNVLYLKVIAYESTDTPIGNNQPIHNVVLIIGSETGKKKWTSSPINRPNPLWNTKYLTTIGKYAFSILKLRNKPNNIIDNGILALDIISKKFIAFPGICMFNMFKMNIII